MTRDEEIRAAALGAATRLLPPAANPVLALRIAKQFEAYIRGEG